MRDWQKERIKRAASKKVKVIETVIENGVKVEKLATYGKPLKADSREIKNYSEIRKETLKHKPIDKMREKAFKSASKTERLDYLKTNLVKNKGQEITSTEKPKISLIGHSFPKLYKGKGDD